MNEQEFREANSSAPIKNSARHRGETCSHAGLTPRLSTVNSLPAVLLSSGLSSTDQARWFVEKVQPHERSLRAYLRARFPTLTDTEDLVQETYLRLFRARESGKTDLNKSYVFTVARNAAFDLCRRNQVISIEGIADLDGLPVMESGPDAAEAASQEQEIAILIEAIQALPERCRQVVTLRKIYDFSHKEIAVRLNISENTVNVQVTLGMARLRDFLRTRGVNNACRP